MVQLVVESWLWWSLVILVAASRFISRRLTLGAFRRFQFDDYLMLLILGFYTTLIVTINIIQRTSSNLLPPGFDVQSLTPSEIAARVYGSKLVLVVEQCQCVTIWGAKGCLILMYLRLTSFRTEHLAVKLLGVYVILTFVVMETLYFGVWCRPFSQYWAVPTDNVQCDAATNHLITNASFNLTSDCLMLAIGLPMFLRMKIPWQKRLPMIAIFSLGIFVILAAVLNKVYSFTQPYGEAWSYWYVRESSTALLVANLPFIWNFWRRVFRIKPTTVCGITDSTSQSRKSVSENSEFPALGNKRASCAQATENADLACNLDLPLPANCRELSFEEWLASSSSTACTERTGSINPYTHPALFYSTRVSSPGNLARCPSIMEKAILNDSPLQQTSRRDSSRDSTGHGRSPVSSLFSSLSTSSKRSAQSFV